VDENRQKMAIMVTDDQRVKSLLTEAVKLLCKSILTYRSEFSIDGLLGITVDSSQVLLVSIHESVASHAVETMPVETISGATSVILVTPDTGTDISQFVEFGGLVQDGATKIVVDAGPLSDTATHAVVAMETVAMETADEAMSTQPQPYPDLEAAQASLFTTAELDELIDNCPSAGIISDSSCDVFAEVAITSESSSDGDKQLVASSVTVSKEPLTSVDEASLTAEHVPVTVDEETLLLPTDVEDAMPSCLSWDDDLSDIGPLNLAGPQDLSLQLDKKVSV